MKRAFMVLAAVIAVAWLALRTVGSVRYVSALSGTLPEGVTSMTEAALGSAVHVGVHFAFVLVAPALVLAAGLLHLHDRRLGRRPHSPSRRT